MLSLRLPRKTLVTALAFSLYSTTVLANPAGGVVSGGTAVISTDGNTLNIDQSSNRAVIDWRSFNIDSGETTAFHQPSSSSITLNRVNDVNPSNILGNLTANGKIILINPNGVFFGPNSKVDVAGLVASTANISNKDFMSGNMQFNQPGNADAQIINQGTITAKDAGLVGFVAPRVKNSGIINAKLGHVQLASGDSFTLDMAGDKLITVAVNGELEKQIASNEGTINAQGGVVKLTAAAARGVVDSVVTNSGTISANGLSTKGGKITLYAANGTATNSGKLDVSGTSGGQADVLGKKVHLTSTSNIDASGINGGGTVKVGGDYQGQGTTPTADYTNVDSGSVINANAVTTGNGGKVTVWSNNETDFAGEINAKGGSISGNGGFVETSGHKLLAYKGKVNVTAPKGQVGTLLLDPENITIQTAGSSTTTGFGGTFSGNSDNSILTVADLQAALASANVVVTTGASGSQAGDITVANAVSWTSNNSLTLNAHRDININAGISTTGSGTVSLHSDKDATGTGKVNFGSGGSLTIGNNGVAEIFYNPASYATPTDYSPSVTLGTGAALHSYMLVNNLNDLQNISTNLTGSYALNNDIDATATSGWNSGAGFAPIGAASQFSGVFNGQNHIISNLYINRPAESYIGLFSVNTGTIENVGLANANVRANSVGGILLGQNLSGTVFQTFVSGTMTGGSAIGGLAGKQDNNALISQSFSTATVNGNGNSVGGLLGVNEGSNLVTNSYETGNVTNTGGENTGGLIGAQNFGGAVTYSYSTGSVVSNSGYVAGIVGGQAFSALIDHSYTTSSVNGAYYTGSIVGVSPGNPQGYQSTVSNSAAISNSQLSSGLPSGFSNSIWDNQGNSLAPYFVWNGAPAISFTPNDVTSFYGSTPVYTYSFRCNIGCTEAQAIASGTVSLTSSANSSTNVGSYTIIAGTGSLVFNSGYANYNVSYNSGTLTIAPKQITVTADSGLSKSFGALDPVFTYSYNGLVNGDMSASFTGALSRAAGETTGLYAINQNTLAATGNYTIGTFNSADFTIVPATAVSLPGNVEQTINHPIEVTNNGIITSNEAGPQENNIYSIKYSSAKQSPSSEDNLIIIDRPLSEKLNSFF